MKTKLSQAIAAVAVMGAAAAATAAPQINHDGLGQALLFPLYTAEAGNQTTIHLTNTTGEFKAVKVRFRRATDSADVLDFNLYLSPHDMWTGVVSMGERDFPVLTSADTSCISAAPGGLTKGQEFGVSGDSTKGHIEVIEMASWDAEAAKAVSLNGDAASEEANSLYFAAKHKDGKPGSCQLITDAWKPGGVWAEEYAKSAGEGAGDEAFENSDLGGAPSGGLYGNAYVINVDEAWAASFAPTAIDVYTGKDGNNHHAPRFGLPDLQGPDPDLNILVLQSPDNDQWPDRDGAIDQMRKEIALKNFGMASAADIAAAMAATNLYADYTLGGSSVANTELAVTFPMKYAGFPVGDVTIGAEFTDREENRFTPEVEDWQWSPWVPGQVAEAAKLTNETSLIRLAHKDAVDRNDLGDWNAEISTEYRSGWVDISLNQSDLFVSVAYNQPKADCTAGTWTETGKDDADAAIGTCLKTIKGEAPVIGISNIVIKNKKATPGVNNTYAITHELKYARPRPRP